MRGAFMYFILLVVTVLLAINTIVIDLTPLKVKTTEENLSEIYSTVHTFSLYTTDNLPNGFIKDFFRTHYTKRIKNINSTPKIDFCFTKIGKFNGNLKKTLLEKCDVIILETPIEYFNCDIIKKEGERYICIKNGKKVPLFKKNFIVYNKSIKAIIYFH